MVDLTHCVVRELEDHLLLCLVEEGVFPNFENVHISHPYYVELHLSSAGLCPVIVSGSCGLLATRRVNIWVPGLLSRRVLSVKLHKLK